MFQVAEWESKRVNVKVAFKKGKYTLMTGPKAAKPHRNTSKNRKPHLMFSRIPKPQVHGPNNVKNCRQQDL